MQIQKVLRKVSKGVEVNLRNYTRLRYLKSRHLLLDMQLR